MTEHDKQKTRLGLSENFEAFLGYLFLWVGGLLLLLLERNNRFVRFHALQSFVTFGFFLVLLNIPLIGFVSAPIVSPLIFVVWIYMMVQSARGRRTKLPFVGQFAEHEIYQTHKSS